MTDHTRIQAAQAHDYEGPVGEVPPRMLVDGERLFPFSRHLSDEARRAMQVRLAATRAEAAANRPRLVHALPQDDGTEPTGQGQSWREQAERLHEEVRRLREEASRVEAADGRVIDIIEAERDAERARADAAEAEVERLKREVEAANGYSDVDTQTAAAMATRAFNAERRLAEMRALDIPGALRIHADTSTRPGQYDELNRLARRIEGALDATTIREEGR